MARIRSIKDTFFLHEEVYSNMKATLRSAGNTSAGSNPLIEQEADMNYSHVQWKHIPSTPGYSVSNHGHVRNDKTGKLLNPWVGDRAGHLRVDLPNGRFYVHDLVASEFIGPKSHGLEVCHNDNDPINNRVENLRYDTRSRNVLDLRAVRTHCPSNHEYTELNSYYSPEGWRSCRECRRVARAEYRKKLKSNG